MKPITRKAMQELDRQAIEDYGIPAILLMENAGRAVAEAAAKLVKSKRLSTISVLCGRGNNGGDGLVAARHLFNKGINVTVYYFGVINESLGKGEAGLNLQIVRKMGIPLTESENLPPAEIISLLKKSHLLTDALFGIGLNRPLEEPFLTLIKGINALKRPVVAVDIPSGLDADKGVPLGAVVIATRTVTLAAPKVGLTKPSAKRYVGDLVVADIGIPHFLLK